MHAADAVAIADVAILSPAAQVVFAIIGSVVAIFGAMYLYLKQQKQGDDRRHSAEALEDKTNHAEAAFLDRLENRLDMQQKVADEAQLARNVLTERVAVLAAKLEELEKLKASQDSMKLRLDEKDQTIRELLEQNSTDRESFSLERMKFLEIVQAKDSELNLRAERIYALEAGLARAACPFHGIVKTDITGGNDGTKD